LKNNKLIQKIKPEMAAQIIDTREPLGYFYVLKNGVYVGIDNSNGQAWTEDFQNLYQCKRWLANEWVLHPSMED